MPHYSENQDYNKCKLTKSQRKRLSLERRVIKANEERELSKGKPSRIRIYLCYPIVAFITASLPLWLHYSLEESSIFNAKLYIAPLILSVSLVLVSAYKNCENYFRPQIAGIRERAVAIEVSRLEKWANKEAKLERIRLRKEEVAGLEASFFSVFTINAMFYAQFTIAYCLCLRTLPTNYSYTVAMCLTAFVTLLVTTNYKEKS